MTRFLILALILNSCGQLFDTSKSETNFDPNREIAPRFLEPESTPFVAPGSKQIIASPDQGELGGPALIRLFSEEGAKIYFDLIPFDDVASARVYEEPLSLIPPFELWAVAVVEGEKGKTFEFKYTADQERFKTQFKPNKNRLDEIQTSITKFARTEQTTTDVSKKQSISGEFKLDGKCNEWVDVTKSDTIYSDPAGDMPTILGHVDIVRAGIKETENLVHFMIETKDTPKQREKVVYGISIGPTNITADNFGPGVEFKYQIELQDEQFSIYLEQNEDAEKNSESTAFAVDTCFEASIAKKDLKDVDFSKAIAFRPFAIDWRKGKAVRDKMLPLFSNPEFKVLQKQFEENGQRNTINFFVDDSLSNSLFVEDHIDFSQRFVKTLTQINGIPLFEVSTFPFYYTRNEAAGFAGLNSTDRGLLSTWGKNRNFAGIAQLVAHEFAHYQNAAYSKVSEQWIQEGMSEWSSERALYHHLPAKSVYDTFKQRRIDPFLLYLQNNPEDANHLSLWGKDGLKNGYERAYMFFVLLDHELGSEMISRAMQYGYGMGLNGEQFQKYLERQSGRDLKELFQFYVNDGEAVYDPRELFADDDNDGIMNLDETYQGLDKDSDDSDGNGFYDTEELFRAIEINQSSNIISSSLKFHPSGILRMKSGNYSFISANTDSPYTGPVSAYPPFTVYSEGESEDIGYLSPTEDGFSPLAGDPIVDRSSLKPSSNLTTPKTTDVDDNEVFYDYPFDLEKEYGSYDITAFSAEVDENNNIELVLKTRDAPDISGAWGNYRFEFIEVDDNGSNYTSSSWGSLDIERGEPQWFTLVSPNKADIEEFSISFTDQLSISIPEGLISSWLTDSPGVQKRICVSTRLNLTPLRKLSDTMPCVTIQTDDRVFRGQVESHKIKHSLSLHIKGNQPQISDADANEFLDFIGRSIVGLSHTFQRPLQGINHWTFTVYSQDFGGASPEGNGGSNSNLGILWVFNDTYTLEEQKFHTLFLMVRMMIMERRIAQGLSAYPQSGNTHYLFECFRFWGVFQTLFSNEVTLDHSPYFDSAVTRGDLLTGKLSSYPITLGGGQTLWDRIHSFHEFMETQYDTNQIAELYGTFYNQFPTTTDEFKELFKSHDFTDVDSLFSNWIQ